MRTVSYQTAAEEVSPLLLQTMDPDSSMIDSPTTDQQLSEELLVTDYAEK